MKILKLQGNDSLNKNIEGNSNDIGLYTYSIFNSRFNTKEELEDYVCYGHENYDFLEVDKYIKYIYNVIDNSDYVLMERLSGNVLNKYINNLKYNYYDKIILDNYNNSSFYTNYLFDIRDEKSKQFLKNNITFNLSDEYREPIIFETDRRYILNKEEIDYNYINYVFIKNSHLQLVLYQRDGYIYDYRDIDVREREIKKYK